MSDEGYAGRPLTTEDAGVAGRRVIQFEEGNEYVIQGQTEEFSFTSTPIYGLTKRLELSADFPFRFVDPEEGKSADGFADITLILKTLILSERKWTPACLLRSQVKFSNGNEKKGLGSGDEDYGLIGVMTKTFGPFTSHVNIGYTFSGNDADGDLKNFINHSVALEYRFNKRASLVGEIYGESGKHFDVGSFKHHEWNPLIGLTFQLTETVTFDIAWRTGFINNQKPEYGIIAGLSLNFKKWEPR